MRQFGFILAILAAVISAVYGIECIVCTTKILSFDPYISTLIPNPNQNKYKDRNCQYDSLASLTSTETCYSSNAKCVVAHAVNDKYAVYRGCYTGTALCNKHDGNATRCCTEDLCNGAMTSHSIPYAMIGLVATIISAFLL